MSSGVVPRRGVMRVRRSRLVKPWGSSRWMSRACSSACTRGSPKRSPGMRVPASVTIGVVRLVSAWAPRIGSWLRCWTPSRRRLAVKPICRSAGRLVSRLDSPKSRVSACADDAPGEDQADLVGAADVEVVVQYLLEEDPPGDRAVEHLGEGELGLQDRQLVAVPGRLVLGCERVGQDPQPLA